MSVRGPWYGTILACCGRHWYGAEPSFVPGGGKRFLGTTILPHNEQTYILDVSNLRHHATICKTRLYRYATEHSTSSSREYTNLAAGVNSKLPILSCATPSHRLRNKILGYPLPMPSVFIRLKSLVVVIDNLIVCRRKRSIKVISRNKLVIRCSADA